MTAVRHRKSRRPRPEPRWRARLAASATPQDELDAAWGALTAALATFARRRRDPGLTGRCQAQAETEMREVAAYLVARAEDVYAREREIRNALRKGDTP